MNNGFRAGYRSTLGSVIIAFAIGRFANDLGQNSLKTSAARMNLYLVVGIIVVVAMIAVAISVVSQARNAAKQNDILLDNELAEFQRMRDEGEITEEEYKKMKKIIADKTLEQVRND